MDCDILYAITRMCDAHVERFGEYMVHLLILFSAIFLGAIAYLWNVKAPDEKWELLRQFSNGKLGLYKRRKHVKFGKFERAFATYAIMRNASPGKLWSFVWQIDRIARGGRSTGLRSMLDISGQDSLHEVGFAPPLGLYTVYTGEEDHLSYPEREQYILSLYKKTAPEHKGWREDAAFGIRNFISRWKIGIFVFVSASVLGTAAVPIEVESSQAIFWTVVGATCLSILVAVACIAKSLKSPMWLRASSAALLFSGLVGFAVLPPTLFGFNALSFSTVCEGSVAVERFWTEGTGHDVTYYADVPLPASCRFAAQKTQISPALYNEFQGGRKVVDTIVREGILGYKKITLIGS